MYPTQIGQFGLNHWSKYMQKTAKLDVVLEDGKPRRQDYNDVAGGGDDGDDGL